MRGPAAKGRNLFSLAAVLLAAAATILAPALAHASRYLPQALAPTLAAPPVDLASADGASEVDQHPPFALLTGADRLDLVDLAAGARLEAQRLRLHPTSLELASGRETASGGLDQWTEANVSPSRRIGLERRWSALAYARARWYDARNASWLSEDPAGAVDSPNLYAFVGWAPHMGTDPLGLQDLMPMPPHGVAPRHEEPAQAPTGALPCPHPGPGSSDCYGEPVVETSERVATNMLELQGELHRVGLSAGEVSEELHRVDPNRTSPEAGPILAPVAQNAGPPVDLLFKATMLFASTVGLGTLSVGEPLLGLNLADDTVLAPGLSVGPWRAREVLGRRVYQRSDLFDPAQRSSWFDTAAGQWRSGSNVERMKSGLAPLDSSGRPIQLHHLTGTEVNGLAGTRGSLAEVPEGYHQQNAGVLNISELRRNPNLPRQTLPRYPSFRRTASGERSAQAAEVDAYRADYWRERAKGF
jgi:RHS repeat-associated protein